MNDFLQQKIQFLPGVGPKRAEMLQKELKIGTFEDLLYYFPYKYVDRTQFHQVAQIHTQMPHMQIKGVLKSLQTVGVGRKARLVGMFYDQTGCIELVWFSGVEWQKKHLLTGKEYIVFGRPSFFNGKPSIVHPEMEDPATKVLKPSGMFQAFYNTSEELKNSRINSRIINKLTLTLTSLAKDKIDETLPQKLIQELKLVSLEQALIAIHQPKNTIELKNARFRLKLEELFWIQLKILSLKHLRKDKFKGFNFTHIGFNFNRFYKDFLPFELTNAQKRVIKEIRSDMNNNQQMNRLLQGDVGSGKTLVALMCMLIAIDNGYQTCLMAPTEILAQQHFKSVNKFLSGMNLNIGLLTGSTKKSEREVIHENLQSGQTPILIGTHALLEDTVNFSKLGLVVIDEQHRFGVAQRAKLWKKNDLIPPHVLLMTATPIPRTLAMTVYGDLDISVIDELPPGRKPIETMHFYNNKREQIYQFMHQQLQENAQIYIVYPLISESEKMDLKSLEEGFRQVSKFFSDYKVGMVHGKMKPALKDQTMERFKSKELQILVATTVIEVGVDVPNASVMMIENAERFGLSQLHQLRGRVGRGAVQSYCILISSHKISAESKKRLSTMVRTNDGFKVAEVDMKLRGPGDISGTMQSGMGFDLKISNLAKDNDILQLARQKATDILDEDPHLQSKKNKPLLKKILEDKNTNFDWSSIS